VLTCAFVALAGAGITRSGLLWSPRSFEESSDVRRTTFAQTYSALRQAYAPAENAASDVLLLGNSRIWLAARPSFTEPALRALGHDVAVRNLGIFGAGIGDLEMLGRHLARRPARLAVVTIGGDDLVGTPMSPLAGIPTDLLRIGWSAPSVGAERLPERVDRWARTVWPLYRFREFARAALVDRVRPDPAHRPFPSHFARRNDVFALMYGPRASGVSTAFDAWRRDGTLDAFVAYLRATGGSNLDLAAQQAAARAELEIDDPGPRALAELLRVLGEGAAHVLVVVMPEHPVLEQDVAGRWHEPGRSDRAFDVVRRVADAAGVPVVDGRGWMPAEAFLDLDHLFPELSGFHVRLAEEVAHALDA